MKSLDLRTTIVVSALWVVLICTTVGLGIDVHLKNMARAAFNNWESPIQLVPGSEAMQTFVFPDDPSVDAPLLTAGPAKGYILLAKSDSPFNSDAKKQRAYLYDNGKTWSLFVLTAKASITLDKSWSLWVVNNTVTQITWLDENHLSFYKDGRFCTVEVGDSAIDCD